MADDSAAQHAHQRRGFALVASSMWVIYGFIVVFFHEELIVAPDWIPGWLATPDLTGLYYIVLGGIALALAKMAKARATFEALSYRLLIVIPGLMAALLIPSAIAGHAPGGVVQGSLFVMFSVTSYYISGWRPLVFIKEGEQEVRL